MARVGLFSLEDPNDGLSMQVLYCLRAIGATVHVLTDDRLLPIARSRFCKSYSSLPMPEGSEPDEAFIAALEKFCENKEIDVLVPCDIRPTLLLAAARPRLRRSRVFISSAPELIARLNDKWNFRLLLQKLGLPHPETFLVENREQVRASAEALGFPLVAKPRALSGGRGVAVLHSMAELDSHLAGDLGALPLLLQRFVPGVDGGVSLLAESGRLMVCATQRKESDGTIEFLRDVMAERIAAEVVAASGYSGVAHIDLRFPADGSGVLAIECNPRLWYSCPAAAWQGLNFVELGLRGVVANGAVIGQEPLRGIVQPLGAMISRIRRAPVDIGRLSPGTWRAAYYALSDPRPIVHSRRSR